MGDEMISDERISDEKMPKLTTFSSEMTSVKFNEYINNRTYTFEDTVKYIIKHCEFNMTTAMKNYRRSYTCEIYFEKEEKLVANGYILLEKYVKEAMPYIKEELEKEPRNFKCEYEELIHSDIKTTFKVIISW